MNFPNQKHLFRMKHCSKCHKGKPETTDYFYWDKSQKRFSSWCRECHKERQHQHDEKRRAFAKGIAPEGFKQCSKCKVIKPATNEFFAKSGDKLRASCKACAREYTKEYKNRIVFKKTEETIKKIKIDLMIKSLVFSIVVVVLIYLLLFH